MAAVDEVGFIPEAELDAEIAEARSTSVYEVITTVLARPSGQRPVAGVERVDGVYWTPEGASHEAIELHRRVVARAQTDRLILVVTQVVEHPGTDPERVVWQAVWPEV